VSSSAVHELISQLDYRCTSSTAAAGGERAGCLVGFGTQCSINPPRFLVCLSDKNHTFRWREDAELLVVHPLPERRLVGLGCSGRRRDTVDKFEALLVDGGRGTPVFGRLRNWFAGRILERLRPATTGVRPRPVQAASDTARALRVPRAVTHPWLDHEG